MVIDIKLRCRCIQSYSPCGTNVYPHITHGFLGPCEKCTHKCILIGSAVFAMLTGVPNTHTHTHTWWSESSRSTDPQSHRWRGDSPRHRCDLRWANRPMRKVHGLPQTSQVHITVPLAATGSFLAFCLATRAAVRLSSKADMAFEQHCLQTLLSMGAVRNTEGARSHARRLILRLSL